MKGAQTQQQGSHPDLPPLANNQQHIYNVLDRLSSLLLKNLGQTTYKCNLRDLTPAHKRGNAEITVTATALYKCYFCPSCPVPTPQPQSTAAVTETHGLGWACLLHSGLGVTWQGWTDQGRITAPGNSQAAAPSLSNPAVLSTLAAVCEATPVRPAHLPPQAGSWRQGQFGKGWPQPGPHKHPQPLLMDSLAVLPPLLLLSAPGCSHPPCSHTGTALER